MRASPIYVIAVLASLASGVVGNTLYRNDGRKPATIKEEGGFKARGFDKPEGTLFEHVEGTLKKPSRDPFISTTIDHEYAEKHGGGSYLYTIDSSHITTSIHNVAAEYEAAERKYGHANEKEFAVEHLIPWSAVTKVEKKKDGKWQTIKMPSKRMPEFLEEDVFVA